jgi:hypothetical protein
MRDYESKTIKKLRHAYPSEFSSHLDDEIAHAYHVYCEMFHAAGWTEVPPKEFMEWATTPPIIALNVK